VQGHQKVNIGLANGFKAVPSVAADSVTWHLMVLPPGRLKDVMPAHRLELGELASDLQEF